MSLKDVTALSQTVFVVGNCPHIQTRSDVRFCLTTMKNVPYHVGKVRVVTVCSYWYLIYKRERKITGTSYDVRTKLR